MVTIHRPYVRSASVATPRLDLGGCVLYAPFWHPTMAGSSFQSKDKIGSTCTVTGATWNPGFGIKNDGTDDIITCGSNASVIAVTGNFSLCLWVIPTSSSGTRDLINTRDTNNNNGMSIEMAAGSLAVTAYFYVGGFTGTVCNTSLTSGVFNCFGISRATNTITYYLAGAVKNNFSTGGTGTDSAGAFQIGAWQSGTIVNEQAGTFGEVIKWNRTLTDGDFMRYYQQTKWRYS